LITRGKQGLDEKVRKIDRRSLKLGGQDPKKKKRRRRDVGVACEVNLGQKNPAGKPTGRKKTHKFRESEEYASQTRGSRDQEPDKTNGSQKIGTSGKKRSKIYYEENPGDSGMHNHDAAQTARQKNPENQCKKNKHGGGDDRG